MPEFVKDGATHAMLPYDHLIGKGLRIGQAFGLEHALWLAENLPEVWFT